MKKVIGLFFAALAGLLVASGAQAVVCTTNAGTGTWATAATWSCGHVPVAADTVVISRNITAAATAVAGLTVNTGVTLADGGFTLAITGNLTNNGTISGTGRMDVTGAASVIDGSGAYAGSRLYTSGAAPSIAVGAVLNFSGSSRIYAGRNSAGTTVATSVLTINGTINSTIPTATTAFLRLYANSTVVGSTGVISASVSAITYNAATTTLTNNGSVSVNKITQNAAGNSWTQGANSSLTVTAVSTVGVLNASATGNTVTYTAPATPITPSAAGYYNLAGTGVTCPLAYTVSGSSPCTVAAGTVQVTKAPTACVSIAGIGTVAWATPANAQLSDTLYATATVNGTSNYLKCTGYGFAIPANATILGVTVSVTRKSSATTSTTDAAMRLIKAGVIGTIDRSATTVYITADVPQVHGTLTDLWGLAWTPADINLATFGAAFAAKTTKSRTISVNYMPITVSYSLPPATPDHIQIEHSGAGKTCAPEQLTVKACSDAACTSNFTGAAVTGNVTWAGAPGGTLPFSMVSGGTGQVTLSLPVSTAQTVTLGTNTVSPAPTAVSGCTNLAGGAACNLIFTAATTCLDAVEVGAAASTPIFTKLSGTAFSLDVKTVAGTNLGTAANPVAVQVELVNAATGTTGCAGYTQLATQNVSFKGVVKMPASFTYANAVRNARVRMTSGGATPGAASSCSSDAFVIRPTALAITSTANADSAGMSTTATPIKAGTNFTLTATAIAGYDGTPLVDAGTPVLPHVVTPPAISVAGLLGGAFAPAVVASGVATGAFTYDEVGYFKFNINGVSDKTFANLDALEAIPECTLDYSNTLVGGKYGCYIGNTAASAYFGRFIPDHFITSVTMDCNTFVYSGQPLFDLSVTAVAAVPAGSPAGTVGATTQNYTGSYAKTVTLSDALNTGLGALSQNTVLNTDFAGGIATPAVKPVYTFASAMTAPADIRVKAFEASGADQVSTVTGAEGVMKIRSGRVLMSNAYGSELLNMSVPVFAQYWNGSSFITNVDDDVATCSSFAAPVVTLQSGETVAVTMPVDSTVSGNRGFTAGNGSMLLTKPGVAGYADVALATPAWLPGNTARATFGVYVANNVFIFRGRHGR